MSGVPSDKVTSGSFVNPKVGASCDPVDSWYRYYAGYSAGFVEQALKEFAESAKLVLDPWNGTGTTTVVAASKKVPAVGFVADRGKCRWTITENVGRLSAWSLRSARRVTPSA